MQIHKTYHPSRYYTSFCSIPEDKFLQKVQYFEKHQNKISLLDENERYKIYSQYLSSLFHVRAYTKYICFSDQVIQMSLNNDLEKSLDNFYLILYRKLIAYFIKGMYKECDQLCRQMFIMKHPYDINKFFILANKRIIRSKLQLYKNIIVLSLSCAVICYFINVIIISAFYPSLSDKFNIIVLIFLGFSVASLMVSEIYSTQKAKSMLSAIMTESRSSQD